MALPTVVAVGAVGTGSTSITPGLPSGWAADDIHLLFVETNTAPTAPSGWADVTDSPQSVGGGGNATALACFWRRAVAGDTDPTVTTANHGVGFIIGVRGCIATGDPWDVTAGGSEVDDTTLEAGGDTTTVADCLVVIGAGRHSDVAGAEYSGWTNTDLANLTERADDGTITGSGGGVAIVTGEKATAGAFGTTTATLATTTNDVWITVALKPPAGGGATASPGVIAVTATLPSATKSAGATVAPAAIAATSSLPSASKSGGMGATATPAVLAGLTTLPASTPSAGSSSAPANIATSASLPAAEASTSGDAQAQPLTIAVITTLPAASASGGATIAPGAITVLASLPQSSVPLDASVAPGLIQLVASVLGATATGVTYVFHTPTYEVAHGTGSLWGRITFDRGFSVLKLADGSYEQRTATRVDEVEAALAFYQGGRDHIVTASEKDDLETAGFTVDTV